MQPESITALPQPQELISVGKAIYYIDYQAAIDKSKADQFRALRQSLMRFCMAAYSENKRRFDAGNLKYLIDQLRQELKSARLAANTAEWRKLIDLLIEQLDIYQDSVKTQLLR